MIRVILISFILSSKLFALFPSDVSGQILYLMHQGESEKALSYYLSYSKENNADDFELLQQACMCLLEEGIDSQDPETELMCIFGAGVAANASLIPILERGVESSEMKIQVTSLHFLAKLSETEADQIITHALGSPFLLTRLEAAYILAQKKEARVVDDIHALYYKVPPQAKPVFAEIISPLITTASTKFFEELLNDSSPEVRLSAIHEIGKKRREDLLARIRSIATLPDNATQECALNALSEFQDEHSKPLFWQMVRKKNECLRLVSLKALYALGEHEVRKEIFDLASQKNLYAISLLGSLDKEESTLELLRTLSCENDFTIALNAHLALLKLGDPLPLAFLSRVILQNEKAARFMQQHSPGHGCSFWAPASFVKESEPLNALLNFETLKLRESVLTAALEFPEEDFLKVARSIFESRETQLIPALIELLINHRSEKAIALLKQMQQKAGAPLIRNYCNLALYTLDIEGPYEQNLLSFVKDAKNHPLIRFKETPETDITSPHDLNPEERSQLLISSFEILASKQNKAGINALIHAIAYGNPKNKYALAGLLMRTTE